MTDAVSKRRRRARRRAGPHRPYLPRGPRAARRRHARAARRAAAVPRARVRAARMPRCVDTFLQSRGQVLHVHERPHDPRGQAIVSDDAFVRRQRAPMAV
ncbi:hypothetical protein C6P78_18365 [Burkholderia multivorans]|nr:hypothetical protein C6P78_18365 [Burkholderia multivorans]